MITRSNEDLGRLLVEEGFITERQLEKARADAERRGEPLQKTLVSMGFVSDKDIVESMGKQMGVAFVDLDRISTWTASSWTPNWLDRSPSTWPSATRSSR